MAHDDGTPQVGYFTKRPPLLSKSSNGGASAIYIAGLASTPPHGRLPSHTYSTLSMRLQHEHESEQLRSPSNRRATDSKVRFPNHHEVLQKCEPLA